MKCFKTLCSLLALVIVSHLNVPAAWAGERADKEVLAAKHAEEEAFAKSFAQQVLAIIQDPKKSFADRKTVLRQAFGDSVDIDWMAKFVLGKSWATATEEQRAHYVTLYHKYLTETYVSNFAENPDKRIRDIKIYGVNDSEDDEDFIVRTEMMLADMENLQVNYRVCEKQGHYRVRDIAIENVSLINTHRAEFRQLAVTQGVDSVIAELEQRLERMRQPTMSMSQNNYSAAH